MRERERGREGWGCDEKKGRTTRLIREGRVRMLAKPGWG